MSISKIPSNHLIRGNIDLFQAIAGGQGRLAGWVFREDTPIDRVEISLGGKPWISAILHQRPDVRAAFEPVIGLCPHLSSCGFDVTAPLPDEIAAIPDIIIELTPFSPSGLRLDPLFTYYCAYQDELERVRQPPAALQERVGGSKDFIQIGVQLACLLMTCVGKFKPDFQSAIILDWGCGCGRVISQMRKFVPPENQYGCDIDSVAIDWNKENISGPKFIRVEPYPPTPYANCSFDVVYGIPVLTHLDEETQILWLSELKRITRPGAILSLSVIGEKLRTTNMPASLEQHFAKTGFAAFVPSYSDMLSEFSHQGYYKEAYHSVDYIATDWSRYFDILEYVQTKHQDIVILRSP
jgi:SAM-dependent methyltransferase